MTMVAVATQRGSGYASFPRTGPHRTSSRESTHAPPPGSPSPWFPCSAEHDVPPEADRRPPSPTENNSSGHHISRFRQRQRESAHQQRQSPRYSIQKQRQTNYPTTIQFTPSRDDRIPFDEGNFNLSLNEVSLEDTFGFAGDSKNDNLFERLYARNEVIGNEEEEDTLQSSSVDLNPYSPKDFGAELGATERENRIDRNAHSQAARDPARRGGDGVFRSRGDGPSRIAPAAGSGPTSYEKKINENMQLLSPSEAMNRRHTSKLQVQTQTQTQAQAQAHAQAHARTSPTSSFFTAASPARCAPLQCEPLQRANTGTSILRNNAGASSRSRNRSTSRNHRSRSRGASRGRASRSRSTSVAPPNRGASRRGSRSRSTSVVPPREGDDPRPDDYHQNLFRGAKMIREQLLRSMASADQAMDEAEREFMEEMIERGGGQQQLRVATQNKREKNNTDDNEDIDFDYSFDHGKAGAKTGIAPSPSRGNSVGITASQDSSALETESRRLDNLMSIFGTTSSTASCNVGTEVKISWPDKENVLEKRRIVDSQSAEVGAPHVVTPMSSLGLSSPTSQLVSPMQNTKVYNEHAGRYFREDAPKPIATSPTVDSAPMSANTSIARTAHAHKEHRHQRYQVEEIPTVDSAPMSAKTSIARTAHAHKEHRHQKYQAEEVPTVESAPMSAKTSSARTAHAHEEHRHQKYQAEEVDEALAHARGAGPFWRALVGNHVRFPSRWDALLPPTSPPIHGLNHKWSKWFHVARHRVKGDKRLNSREFGVRSRRSGGRILMRLVVREMHSQQACREIAIGCFHPNSQGIRKSDPLPEAEDVREVWMAVRWLMDVDDDEPTLDLRREGDDYEGVVDNFLMQKRSKLDYGSMGSALGHRKAVNNENVRAMFGDQPQMTTVDLHEDEIADILKANGGKKLAVLPALLLLKLFLFSK